MIVRCPACRKGYRLEDGRAGPGRKLRCTACGHLFPCDGEPKAESAAASPTPRTPPPSAMPAAIPKPAGTARPLPQTDGALALLADGGRPFRNVIRPLLLRLGCQVELADEGTEAFRFAVARRPALLIASVHLAGLSGVAICEGIKGSPHLRGTKVVLVGSDLSADLFNSDTARAYGADLFLDERMEGVRLTRELATLLGRPEAAVPAETTSEGAEPYGESELEDEGPDVEIARLARLMLADLRLYNAVRFESALRDGRLLETFKAELSKGREIVDHRFPEVEARHQMLATALQTAMEQEKTG